MVEIQKEHQDPMITSEYSKNWTEKSPNSKLNSINSTLNDSKLSKINEIKNLKTQITNRNYREFQKLVWVPYNRCDWKIWPESLSYFNNYIDKLKSQNNVGGNVQAILWNLRRQVDPLKVWQIENVVDTLNIQHAEANYLLRYETMKESEYNRLFSWKEKLRQWQFGDCYLVSWINELARAQQFDTWMRTSIQRVKWKDGSGSGYQIKIPLWEPSWRKIIIKDSELPVAKIRWNTWYKLLELAYAKNKLRKNDRQGNTYRPITSWEFEKIKWWWTKEVLETFIWKQNISFNTFWDKHRSKPLNRLSTREKSQITWFLKNYIPGIGNRFLSLSSIWWDDRNGYKVGNNTIYHWHAYSITWVNKDKKNEIKSITILNPWNNNVGAWKQYVNLTLDEFFNWFSYMSYGKIKTKTFLDSKAVL